MAVTAGNLIQASDYNGLQNKIATILGNGSSQSGYGQTVRSSQVSGHSGAGTYDGDIVTAEQMQALWDDMNDCYQHQNGIQLPITRVEGHSDPDNEVFDGHIIGADATGQSISYNLDGSYTINVSDAVGGFNDYDTYVTDIQTNKFTASSTQMDPIYPATGEDSRTTDWRTVVTSEFTAKFTSSDHRRHFFNSGGQILINMSMASNGSEKDEDWNSMLESPSPVRFGYTATTASGTGATTQSIGNYDLVSGAPYTEIMRKYGSQTEYAENYWTVQVKEIDDTTIGFLVTLVDADVGDDTTPSDPYPNKVDETVKGEVVGNYGYYHAKGDYVAVDGPTIAVTTDIFE